MRETPTETVPTPAAQQTQESGKLGSLLSQLAVLIANITESYTVAIFRSDPQTRALRLAASHTLSREFVADVVITPGAGLIGWTAQNAVRISVCPFEHDATTLLYYSKNQDLKSFIAVPILGVDNEVLGVISCDSKKSYAYAKIVEKTLTDCAKQAAELIALCEKVSSEEKVQTVPNEDLLTTTLKELRSFDDEDELLSRAARLPAELVRRDALVVLTTSERGVGSATFYSSSNEAHAGNRLLELVCKHKKVICSERSVHALPVDDTMQRSFLSVPFHVLDSEAGSLNLLSKPHLSFAPAEIAAVESVAKVLGRELERIRLRERFMRTREDVTNLSWKQFSIKVKSHLESTTQSTLHRLRFTNIANIEQRFGMDAAETALLRVTRLASQIAQPQGLTCCTSSGQIFLFSNSDDASRTLVRLRRLIERLGVDDGLSKCKSSGATIGVLLNNGLEIQSVDFPRDGATLDALVLKMQQGAIATTVEAEQKKVANVGHR